MLQLKFPKHNVFSKIYAQIPTSTVKTYFSALRCVSTLLGGAYTWFNEFIHHLIIYTFLYIFYHSRPKVPKKDHFQELNSNPIRASDCFQSLIISTTFTINGQVVIYGHYLVTNCLDPCFLNLPYVLHTINTFQFYLGTFM